VLQELKVINFAIIENLDIQFRSGLNILSGETGAGKSVLLKSLGLLMGQKGSVESIRSGCTQASVEGCFDLSKRKDIRKKLEELGIDTEEQVLVVRRVLSGDKSRVYLNGTMSTLNALRDVVSPLIEVAGHSAPLIEMTGQHENRNLISKAYHLDLLDQYVGAWETRLQYSEKFDRMKAIEREIVELEREAQHKAQRLDFLIFQRDEIHGLELDPEADRDIETEIKKLKNSARLSSFVDSTEETLYSDDDSAVSRLKAILKRSFEVAQIDPGLEEKLKNLEQARSVIEDVVYDLRQYVSRIESDPGRLEELESRLSGMRKLQKKYGPAIDDIFNALKDIETEIKTLENSDQRILDLQAESAKLEKELRKIAATLHEKRANGSRLLADSVNSELLDLNMKGVTFHVSVEKLPELTSSGISDVEFLSQTSSKDPKRPLAKFASGGELSRILLSLKRVVGSSHQPRTYLFDEVDTGVSGPTAEKVGRKLKSIAKGQQVICVTHLPQVAAYGDAHFFIQKSPQKGSVAMEILELKQKDRVQEIARLISGEKISKTSLAHAEQLLSEAR
jgi:DNA repair protein RecN (Recombination protein N)